MSNTSNSVSINSLPESAAASHPGSTLAAGPHELECLIQRTLQTHPGLKFARLKVHQCPQGVCLEGLLETNEDGIDLCDLVKEIAGVKVINHVVSQLNVS